MATNDHTYTRLLLNDDSTVVAYLAPNFKVSPVMKHKLHSWEMPDGESTKVKDIGQWRWETVVQGTFYNSDSLYESRKNTNYDREG